MKQKISIECKLPDTSYSLKIQEVHEIENKLICVSKLTSKSGGGEAITKRKDSIEVLTHSDTELPVKHYIIMNNVGLNSGHWARKSNQFTAIDDMKEIKESINNDSIIYKNIITEQKKISVTDNSIFKVDTDFILQKSTLDLNNISQDQEIKEYRGKDGIEIAYINISPK